MKRFLLILSTLLSLATGMAHEDLPLFRAAANQQGSGILETPNKLNLSRTIQNNLIMELLNDHAVANRLFNVGDDSKSVNAFRNLLPHHQRKLHASNRIPIKMNGLAFKVGF